MEHRMDFNNPPLGYRFFDFLMAKTPLSDLFYKGYVLSLGLKGNEKILEFGSGGGNCSKYLSDLLSGKGFLTCVDNSEFLLSKAKKRLGKSSNIEFLLGDISKLKIKNSFYDAAVIHFVLHDIPEESQLGILKTISRKLKKKGRVFIREPIRQHHGMESDEIEGLMDKAGLKKFSSKEAEVPLRGPSYEGIFVKK